RAVTAMLLHNYKPYDNRVANHYISAMGRMLAMHSHRPCTFSGYSFLIIDTLEPASFSASGGFVLISRGLLRCCPNEDAVAAVLAHEIAHVQQQHTLNLIKKSRLVPPKEQSSKQLSETLAGTANNIVSAITNSGHARKREREADRIAIQILKRTGFNPTGMQQFLQQLNKHHHGMPETKEHKTVHTDPNVRLKEIDPLIRDFETIKESIKRKARFDKSLTGI
ncbi:MAG: M48 family metallopeptidase, partial [Kiritimatiellae bacterium]|nr:M48 family metallopeptidase [Kiritimatiellia bacterium]